jgi:hypothetical protein
VRRAAALRRQAVQCAAAIAALSVPAIAQNEEPSLDFLEYLGSWEDDDEAWYVDVQTDETQEDGPKADDDQSPKEARAGQDDE